MRKSMDRQELTEACNYSATGTTPFHALLPYSRKRKTLTRNTLNFMPPNWEPTNKVFMLNSTILLSGNPDPFGKDSWLSEKGSRYFEKAAWRTSLVKRRSSNKIGSRNPSRTYLPRCSIHKERMIPIRSDEKEEFSSGSGVPSGVAMEI